MLHYTSDQAKLHVNNVTVARYERRPLFLPSLPQGKPHYALPDYATCLVATGTDTNHT